MLLGQNSCLIYCKVRALNSGFSLHLKMISLPPWFRLQSLKQEDCPSNISASSMCLDTDDIIDTIGLSKNLQGALYVHFQCRHCDKMFSLLKDFT